MTQTQALLSLQEAKALVSYLEKGDHDNANLIIQQACKPLNQNLFEEVGRLTRQLHSTLSDFQMDERLTQLTRQEIPDAKERLNYVIDMTEQAANRTMDAIDASIPIADGLHDKVAAIAPQWDQLMQKEIGLTDFKHLCHEIDQLFSLLQQDTQSLKSSLTEILMAQDFQDLTGQVIRRVIDLVREVEESLVKMLPMFGDPIEVKDNQKDVLRAEGPVVDSKNRQEVVQGQDDVDDLLSSLGF